MITSASNDKIKEIKKLIKSASRRKETGLYIVEGIRMVREIPADAVKTLYAVLPSVSRRYPPPKGRLLTRYSPVRHSVISLFIPKKS